MNAIAKRGTCSRRAARVGKSLHARTEEGRCKTIEGGYRKLRDVGAGGPHTIGQQISPGKSLTVERRKGGEFGPDLILCGHYCGSAGGSDRGVAAEDGRGDQSDDEANGEGLDKGVGHVDQGVLVELLRVPYGSDLRGGGGGVESGGLDPVDLGGEIAVHKVGHEVEVDDLPHGDVADGGDERNQDAAGEGAAEGDSTCERGVAVAADAEVDEQERRHHDGIAENHAVAGADLVGKEERPAHEDGDNEARDEAEGEDSLFHMTLLMRVRMESRYGLTGPNVVILSDDFAGMERKSCFRVRALGDRVAEASDFADSHQRLRQWWQSCRHRFG